MLAFCALGRTMSTQKGRYAARKKSSERREGGESKQKQQRPHRAACGVHLMDTRVNGLVPNLDPARCLRKQPAAAAYKLHPPPPLAHRRLPDSIARPFFFPSQHSRTSALFRRLPVQNNGSTWAKRESICIAYYSTPSSLRSPPFSSQQAGQYRCAFCAGADIVACKLLHQVGNCVSASSEEGCAHHGQV
ncbi:hypothetical protein GQ54DRAFT_73498 [Martensiomyces pterosporus]|nr:hypothetical protein GQ54DRAFT_73498 [Martensiomyces pterosporus]